VCRRWSSLRYRLRDETCVSDRDDQGRTGRGRPGFLGRRFEVYGADPKLRAAIRLAGLGYVLQVSANRRMPTPVGPIRVDELAARLPARAWQKASAGAGSKGETDVLLGLGRHRRRTERRRRTGGRVSITC
jgi:hypothetical protein